MPTSLDGKARPDTVTNRALDHLRGKPNPFENLVRPQRPDDRFADLHVSELLRKPRELLLRLIDAYRLQEYRRASDLRDTRVVTIVGARGAGKTHMLESLAHREDDKTQLLIRPAYYEPRVPFEEYLLGQLVSTLMAADRPFEAVAAQLTRRLLRQALHELQPTDRLFACIPARRRRLRLLWGGGESLSRRFDRLADALDEAPGGNDLPGLVRRHGFESRPLLELIEAHLERHEDCRELSSAVRRQLYQAMARATLLQDGEALAGFLEAECQPTAARPLFRIEVVRQRLHVLIEACALVQLPLVFAFDNLEGFLAPQGRFDRDLAIALMDNLAQAVDSLRGLLFLVFAESALFREVNANTNQFALDRLHQGVPLTGEGPVDMIELKPPDFEELRQLIAQRVRRLLKDFPQAGELPVEFPYGREALQDIAQRQSLELRNKLLRLRDEYSRVVYGRGSEEPPIKREPDWPALLERAWNEQLTAAAAKLQGSLVSRLQELHVGLGRLLLQAGEITVDGWRLTEVQPSVSVGEHPSYGIVTLLTWRSQEEAGEGRPAQVRLGVGLLLAGGPGMSRDLAAKFDLFKQTALAADGLVVLWPRAVEDDDLAAALPEATRKVWQSATARRRRQAVLRQLPTEDLRKMLAFPEWTESAAALAEATPPEEAVRTFLHQQCQSIFHLVLPNVSQGVAVHAD